MNLFLIIFYLLSVLFLYFVIHHKIINQNVKETSKNNIKETNNTKETNNKNVKENTKNIKKNFQYSIKPKYECRDFCSEEICNYYNKNEKNPKYTECQLYN